MAKILIVDDSAFVRMMLKDILSREGHEIAGEAANATEGVAKYSSLKPDLVLMDIVMPGMDGVEAVRQIMKENPDAAVLMVSALGQEAMVKEALEAGAKDFVTKPLKKDILLEAVSKVLL